MENPVTSISVQGLIGRCLAGRGHCEDEAKTGDLALLYGRIHVSQQRKSERTVCASGPDISPRYVDYESSLPA